MSAKEIHVRQVPIEAPPRNEIQQKWWKDDEPHQGVWNVVTQIENRQKTYWMNNLSWARLYENIDRYGVWLGVAPSMLGGAPGQNGPKNGLNHRLTFNVIKSAIDTSASKVAKNKPRARYITNRGTYSQQRKARLLTQYVDGLFYASKAYVHGRWASRDSMIFGTGAVYVYVDPGSTDIKVERVLYADLVIDDLDGLYGEPRQIHRKRYVPRDVLLEFYGDDPEIRRAIIDAPVDAMQANSAADNVLVIESWHRSSGPKSKDGRHSICLQNVTLFQEPWEKTWLPFVFLRWMPRVVGMAGIGLTEELSGIQLAINKLLRMIQVAQELACVPRVFVEEGSSVSNHQLYDFGIIKFKGAPPTFNTASAMPAEIYQHLENLVTKAYALSGVSQLSAAGKKPGGLDSAVALREWNDLASERFSLQSIAYEEFFLELAAIMLNMTRDLYQTHPELKVKAKGKKFLAEIKWGDVNLDEDQYVTECFPVSRLPIEPSSRLQYVQELAKSGLADRDAILELLEIPDIEQYMALHNAPYELAERIVEAILEEGRTDLEPEPMTNLKLTVQIAQHALIKAQIDNEDPDRIELLRAFCNKAQGMIPGQPTEEQPTPTGVPGQAPTGEMLPTVPQAA